MRFFLRSTLLLISVLALAALALACSNETTIDPLVFHEGYHGNISTVYGNVAPERDSANDPTAPDFRWRDSTGALDSLSNQTGKLVVVTFFAEWCGPCHEEAPSFVSMYDKMKDSVEFIGVDVDGNGDAMQHATNFANQFGIKYQVVADSMFRIYDPYILNFDRFSIPYSFVIGRDGSVRTYHKGAANEQLIQMMVQRAE